jgi:double-stranded uracil-DNA glycosylase
MTQVHSFPPIAAPDATRLILGTMPGVASLTAGRYYAHQRNGFWPLLEAALGLPTGLQYEQRCQALIANRIALWDVLQGCMRPGSLDSAIERASMVPNDFSHFFAQHPQIERVYFNGQQAATIWRRLVQPVLPVHRELSLHTLPSSSPANAGMSLREKQQHWQIIGA